jgi:8-oxo-dGTP pyrophosphatase MutT (NUDIX family)
MVTQYKNLIGGEMVGTDRWLDVVNPATEQVIGQVPACGQAELDHAVAAARELYEECGAVASRYTKLGQYHPANGSSNQTFYVYIGHDVDVIAPISDTNEIMSIRWFTPAEIWQLIGRNEIRDGLTLTEFLWTDAYLRGMVSGCAAD